MSVPEKTEPLVTWQNWAGVMMDIEMEVGNVDEATAIELAQFIVDHSLDLQLNGSWGRWCRDLIEAGRITPRA